MKARYVVTAVIIAIFAAGMWMVGADKQFGSMRLLQIAQVASEPGVASAHSSHAHIAVTRKIPLNFGAVVAGNVNRFISLSPDSVVRASGATVNRPHKSYVGNANSEKMSGLRYQIQAGRLTFKAISVSAGQYVLVRFMPGELSSGVNLSQLEVLSGPDTRGVELLKSHNKPNEIMFRVSGSQLHGNTFSNVVEVDLLYGGKLSLADFVNTEINARMEVEVSVVARPSFF